ncbi:MAG: hypothetical protein SNJ57_12495 [Cyanobacteriota bacterium]
MHTDRQELSVEIQGSLRRVIGSVRTALKEHEAKRKIEKRVGLLDHLSFNFFH